MSKRSGKGSPRQGPQSSPTSIYRTTLEIEIEIEIDRVLQRGPNDSPATNFARTALSEAGAQDLTREIHRSWLNARTRGIARVDHSAYVEGAGGGTLSVVV